MKASGSVAQLRGEITAAAGATGAAGADVASGDGLYGVVVPALAGPAELRVYVLPADDSIFALSTVFTAGAPAALQCNALGAPPWDPDYEDEMDADVEEEAKAEAARRDGKEKRLRPERGGTHTAKCIHVQAMRVEPQCLRPCCASTSQADGDARRDATAGEEDSIHISLCDDRGKECQTGAHSPRLALVRVPLRHDDAGRVDTNALPSVADVEKDTLGLRSRLADATDDAMEGGEGSLLEWQHAKALRSGAHGEYTLTYVPRRAGVYSAWIHVPAAGDPSASSAASEDVYLGPWRLVVRPSTLCLATSLAATIMPVGALEVGANLSVLIPLLDRFQNALLLPPLPTTTGSGAYSAGLHADLVRASAASEDGTEQAGRATETEEDTDVVDHIKCTIELLRDAPPRRQISAALAESCRRLVAHAPPARPGTAAALRTATAAVASAVSKPRPRTGGALRSACTSGVLGLASSLPSRGRPPAELVALMAGAPSAAPPPASAGANARVAWRAQTTISAAATAAAVAAATVGGRGYHLGGAPSEGETAAAFAHVSLGSLPNGEWLLQVSADDKSSADPAHRAIDSLVGVDAMDDSCVTMRQEKILVQAGALDATQCHAAGAGIASAQLGQPATFTITPCDANGFAKRVSRGAPFRVSVLNSGGHGSRRLEFQVDARSDGSYSVRYVPFGCAGDFLLQVTFAGKPIAKSPFRVAVTEPPDAKGNAGGTTIRSLRTRPATAPPLTAMQRARTHAASSGVDAAASHHSAAHGMAEGERAVLVALGRLNKHGKKPPEADQLISRLQQMRPPQQRHARASDDAASAAAAVATALLRKGNHSGARARSASSKGKGHA